MSANLGADLSPKVLADRAGVSQRHLGRLFAEPLGTSLGRYVRRAHLEGAHLDHPPLSVVARRCGFASAETLEQSLNAALGATPSRADRR